MPRNIEFLHGSILGDNAGVLDARTFSAVTTGAISLPTYRSKYFETFPSVWANAYAFAKLLKRDLVSNPEVFIAIGEWVSLFALHYLGVAHLAEFSRQEIVTECDPDFWPAVAGTYPTATQIDSLLLLRLDERTILGACYPDVVFFPARGRESWASNQRLSAFLENGNLSWEKVSTLLPRGAVMRQFEIHLRSIANSCLAHGVQETLLAFCDNQFKNSNIGATDRLPLSMNPTEWSIPSARKVEGQANLLEKYPLKQSNSEGGTTYYLLAGIDGAHMPWINTPIAPHLPAPADFRKASDRQISVQLAGHAHVLPIAEKDRIELLAELFLDSAPYWTRFPKNSNDFEVKIRTFHRIEATALPGIFAGTQDDAAIVCLAPLTSKFVREFPSVLSDENAIAATYDRVTDQVRWTLTILEHEIPFATSAVFSKALAESSVAIWPSKAAPEWRIYAAKGTGFKQSYGRWILVDQAGFAAEHTVDVEQDEYVSVIYNTKRPCQPRALLLKDANGRERGLLILSPQSRAVVNNEKRPSLAVDFGTSNTCLASRNTGGEPNTLIFDHAPTMVWGKRLPHETPGFVPFKWGGKRGYYPSILLSLLSASGLSAELSKLRPEHLFSIDIPSLHDRLDGIFLRGTLAGTWAVHTNLKWEQDPSAPWRSLFLALSLLYAHAELFMRDGATPASYVFTFPLAFTEAKRQAFHDDNRALVAKVRAFCFGDGIGQFEYNDVVDESRAIAKSAQAHPNQGVVELFIDVGGGTADIAIRHSGDFLVLDSIRLAGRAFFHFTERNLRKQLLASDDTLKQLVKFNLETLEDRGLDRLTEMNLDLGTAYSVSMNGLDEATFKKREGAILDEASSQSRSYQRYRSQLFFRHLLTYGLLQTCAALADYKISLKDGGINIICSGNAWGLLVFANLHRSRAEIKAEAERILESIKDELIAVSTQDEASFINMAKVFAVNLMNERDLRDAKTAVAIGALRSAAMPAGVREDRGSTSPYIGFTLRDVVVNDAAFGELRWCSRWSRREFAGRADADRIDQFRFEASPAGIPIGPILALFSKMANSTNRKVDQLGPENWGMVNGSIREAYMDRVDLDRSPINYFVSDVLYPEDDEHVILDELARLNRSFGR